MRQRGEDVFFLTGTDEHGEPVAQAAEREGVTPRELADRNAERFKEVAERVNATNDFFIRTSDPEHGAVVNEVVERMKENGYVYKGTYEGWYCPRCADFKTETELLEGNRCPIHLIELEREKEDNWFFRLSAFQEPLEQLYAERPGLRAARQPLQRGALVHQGRAAATSRSPRAHHLGRAGPVGPRAGGLRLDRRASELLLRALLRARGRGPDGPVLARHGPRDRQGHPQVPRGLLAGAADGGRHRGARAGLHPRLPADGRAQDVQVAGQRARPVQGDGPLRHGRAALLPAARGRPSARTGRSRPRASRPATTPSSPTSTATSPAARWR